ncbi:hypothetical protein [Burkholderia contaminans]|uniref:hypothetical protein n=1 Tax=Burkholderia contaminans TaxID=488447 RepID=UPI001F30FD52|nr:hypothetical protein [Burkholderia contaminans]MEB4640061.1 hypothetical protein [Burkholderia contaminans]MEB4654449.1 hypothetical protein [Burkholderia contaminans]MEB4658993.1 hypothetical protein [Burkholderia contaminans]MEB4669959.1 hypothetical protein [Burkholderia contaminans]MEB4682273.1 hypothetical protein [Burkholderia contaminans]
MLSATCLAIRSRAAVRSNSALNVGEVPGGTAADGDVDNMTVASELIKRHNLQDPNFILRAIPSGAGVERSTFDLYALVSSGRGALGAHSWVAVAATPLFPSGTLQVMVSTPSSPSLKNRRTFDRRTSVK